MGGCRLMPARVACIVGGKVFWGAPLLGLWSFEVRYWSMYGNNRWMGKAVNAIT